MTLDEMLRELIAERETDDQAAAWQDAARLLLLLASGEGDRLPPLVVQLALRGAAAALDAGNPLPKDLAEAGAELISQGRDCIRRGDLLRRLSQILQNAQQVR
ncbi:hypothetical protein [Roseicella aquatilis]|uniref:Uncharacterized protein n=1 Tax=Roseicella aquatilis TaxID=2527868 RepID=A0A4R4DT21_9PROT|nr:hypothetical protein [Roseicella aquatilis]TCZ63916.1 hypothetical protein EXY23_07990 [Roseicella aquatilis]